MKSTPLITIGMPVYNCRTTVAEAIASILNQSLEDWELVVFDDGSLDDTSNVVRRFVDPRIRLIDGKTNRGLPARLNEIVRETCSVYFARMDGDDVAYPDRLRRQIEFLRDHPEVDLVAGAIAVFDGTEKAIGVRRGPPEHKQICARPYSGFPMAHPTWLGRSDWFRFHPYREDAVRMEDWDLLFRAYGQSRFANLKEVVQGYREASLSLRKLAAARWHKCRFLVESAHIGGDYAAVTSELGKQAARFVWDAFAVGTGSNHRLLKHRIPPITRAEIETWREVLHAARKTVETCLEEESIPA